MMRLKIIHAFQSRLEKDVYASRAERNCRDGCDVGISMDWIADLAIESSSQQDDYG
jgi:hypothetical protein